MLLSDQTHYGGIQRPQLKFHFPSHPTSNPGTFLPLAWILAIVKLTLTFPKSTQMPAFHLSTGPHHPLQTAFRRGVPPPFPYTISPPKFAIWHLLIDY